MVRRRKRSNTLAAPGTPRQRTTLGRLCRYYLECLSLDDEAGVRIFARSQYALDYVELPEIPGIVTDQPVTSLPGVDDLFYRLRRDRQRKVPYIGYPVRVKWLKSAKWEGFMLEPLFLFAFNDEALRPGQTPVLSEETPAINFSVIKSLAIGNESFVMEEAAKLAEELGLGEPDVPDFDEVVERLTQIRAEWDWKEADQPASTVERGASVQTGSRRHLQPLHRLRLRTITLHEGPRTGVGKTPR